MKDDIEPGYVLAEDDIEPEYVLIAESFSSDLSSKVTYYLLDGYELYGNPFFADDMCFQAVIRG